MISILLDGLEGVDSDFAKYNLTTEQTDRIKAYIREYISDVTQLGNMITPNGFNGTQLDKQYNLFFKSIKGTEETEVKTFFHESFKLKASQLTNITKNYIGKNANESKYKINKIC